MREMNGQNISEAEVDAWVAEAEAGYDIETLRQRGRPIRGTSASSVVAIRFDGNELATLDAYAHEHGISRSEAVRQAVSALVQQ